MRICPFCYNLVADEEQRCLFCHKRLEPNKVYVHRHPTRVRSFPRLNMNIPIKFQALSNSPMGDSLDLEGNMKDISVAGIFFEVDENVNLDQSAVLWISFNLPGFDRDFKIQAEVRRVVPSGAKKGIGVMFLNMELSEKSLIKDFVYKSLSSKTHKDSNRKR